MPKRGINLASLTAALKKEWDGLDPRSLRPSEATRLLNSSPIGEVISERKLYGHRAKAGAKIGDGKTVDLFRYGAWLFDRKFEQDLAKRRVPVADDYEAIKERSRKRQAKISLSGRDIGPIPDVADTKQREECRLNARLFCETYNPKAFNLAWSPDHLEIIRKIEEAVLFGGTFAFALPRGFGKTSLCRMLSLWAIAYGHKRYAFIIGATGTKAEENLDAIKTLMQTDRFAADFPEIAIPIKAIGGVANKASGQLCQGKPTRIEFGKERVILARVPAPANWLPEWGECVDGFAPTANSIIGVSGLTGEGLRGSVFTTTWGEMVRPDFVLLDDPQTDESAATFNGNKKRLGLIRGSVLGMEGPNSTFTVVMPCTVIQPDDMVDHLLDRKRNPLWRGERRGILKSMPTNLEAWDGYFEVYNQCNDLSPPDFSKANQYYKRHRKKLDAGAEASWPAWKKGCVSAIQFAMNLYHQRGDEAFWAELMNQPLGEEAEGIVILKPKDLQHRVNGYARSIVPQDCAWTIGGMDIHNDLLYWAVGAFEQNYTGYCIDYSTWPAQSLPYFLKRQARKTLTRMYPGLSTEDAVGRGVFDLINKLFETDWKKPDGTVVGLSVLIIDQNYTPTRKNVESAARRSKYTDRIILSNGVGIGAGRNQLSNGYDTVKKRRAKRIYQTGGKDQWSLRREDGIRRLSFDTNHWKTFHYTRQMQPVGSSTSFSLFGKKPKTHENIAHHLASEKPTEVSGNGRTFFQFNLQPGHDNHWLDNVVQLMVGASIQGAAIPGDDRRDHGRRQPRGKTTGLTPAELRALKRGNRR